MADEAPEVRIKLVADDHTSETVSKVRFGLENLKVAAKSAGIETEGIGKAAGLLENPYLIAAGAVVAVGAATYEAFEFTKDLAEEALKAATNAEKQERAMGRVMMMMDGGKHTMGELREYAQGVHEDLQKAGLEAGISDERMTTLFDRIVEGGAVGTEKAKELAVAMGTVGKDLRGGPEALAQGFAQIERGMVNQRNELVKIIAATHTLEGNAHSVAKQMQNMTTPERIELATKAIEKMNSQIKKSGEMADLTSLQQTFAGVKEQFFEAMGRPMLDKLLPPLNELKAYILGHLEAIEEFGADIGEAFGKGIEVIVDVSKEVYSAIIDNWDSFAAAGKIFIDPIKEAFQYIYDNKTAFAKTFGDIAADIAKVAHLLVESFQKVADFVMSAAKAVGFSPVIGMEKNKIEKDLRKEIQNPGELDQDKITNMRKKFVDDALLMGENAEQAGKYFDNIYAWHAESVDKAKEIELGAVQGNASKVMEVYNYAAQHHNQAMMELAAKTIAGSEDLRKSMLFASGNIEGGMGEFAKTLNAVGAGAFAKELKDGAIKRQGGITPPVNHMDFRGSHFHVKQDFRDQDPDRVALVFRRDIMRAAQGQGAAKTSSGIGM